MYVGHAAIALLAKSKRPRIPMCVLVPAAFGPDWVAWVFEVLKRPNEVASHSFVSVGFGAAAMGVLYFLATQARTDALVVTLTWVSHWPADFITGLKPTWPNGPLVGLRLYNHPIADVLLESLIVIACWWVYVRSLHLDERRRRWSVIVPVGLIGMQIGFALIQLPAIKDPLRALIAGLRA